jgi:CMP-N,N'-diacetyllegionaminic acid synthase
VEILAIIPARGGSKGLPGKNLRDLFGHPLISYSILAAQSTSLINRIVVSTDDNDIVNVAQKYGAEVPVIRPKEFAQDLSSDFDVFYHMLTWLKENENYVPDYVIQLRPTSPIRNIGQIENAINKLIFSDFDSLRIVTEAPITPYKMWHIDNFDLPMIPIINADGIFEPYNQARQNLPKKYWQIGYLDVIKTDVILNKKSMSGDSILPFLVENTFAVDIDNLEDFEKAELTIRDHDCIKF